MSVGKEKEIYIIISFNFEVFVWKFTITYFVKDDKNKPTLIIQVKEPNKSLTLYMNHLTI